MIRLLGYDASATIQLVTFQFQSKGQKLILLLLVRDHNIFVRAQVIHFKIEVFPQRELNRNIYPPTIIIAIF